jgi:hypothetical protein
MAAGITQPGGAGTTIMLQDDVHADAGGDGSYKRSEIYAKYPADFLDVAAVLGVTLPKPLFISKVSLQNGDGAGTAATTFKDQDGSLWFATGKTYIVSAVGVANRMTELGIEVPGAIGKPTGRNGMDMWCGLTPTIRGNMKIHAGKIDTIGGLVFQPGATGLTARLIDMILEATGNMGFGTSAGEMSFIYNVDGVSLGAGAAGGLVQFNCPSAERLVFSAPNASEIIRTGGQVKVKDMVMVGSASNAADMRNSSGIGPWILVDCTYSGLNPQADLATTDIEDWRTWNLRVMRDAGVTCVSKRVKLLDEDLVAIVDAITDAEGQVTYGSGMNAGSVKVRATPASLVVNERAPMTLIINDPTFADYDPTLESYSRPYTWPGKNYANGRQPSAMNDVITLGPPQPPVPILLEDVPDALPGEQRYEEIVPEMT